MSLPFLADLRKSGRIVSISVFLNPLAAEFGWLRGETAMAYLAGTFSLGLGGIVMGYLADRFSTRHLVGRRTQARASTQFA